MSEGQYASFESPAKPQHRPRKPRWWPWLLAALLSSAALSVGGVLLFSGPSEPWGSQNVRATNNSAPPVPSTITITGSMTILGGYGSSGYRDIFEGAQVEVVNGAQEVIAIGELETSELEGYQFSISDVPAGEGTYGVHIGNENRGVVWAKESDVRTGVLYFHLSLGS